MNILVKLPTRERPERFREVLGGWVRNCKRPERVTWLFSFDMDDPSMEGFDDLPENSIVVYGASNSKVHAINRDIPQVKTPWDVLLVLSDDMHCARSDWDEAIEADIDSPDQLLWYYDGKQEHICTLPLMTRVYYDRFGYVYHPDYLSVFCDNEQTDVAQQLGLLKYISTPLAVHVHPANFTGVLKDALYERNETGKIWKRDQSTWKNRKARNYFL